MILKKQTKGFTLAEMIVSMSILAILFASFGSFISKFFQNHSQASEFIEVQDETFVHVQMIKSLIKSAENVITFPFPARGEYKYDSLVIQSSEYSDAPFALLYAFEKSIDALEETLSYLDELTAANRDTETESYMAISSLYLWSDIEEINEQYSIYTHPQSGEIRIVNLFEEKVADVPYSIRLKFKNIDGTDDIYNDGKFLMPAGITKVDAKTFYVSDRSDHSIWKVELDQDLTDSTTVVVSQEITATREKILGKSQFSGANVECKIDNECNVTFLNQPNGLLYNKDTQELFIADSKNHRILIWNENDADKITELIFNSNYESGASVNKPVDDAKTNFYMNTPIDIALELNPKETSTDAGFVAPPQTIKALYVTDSFNHRVLELKKSIDWEEKVQIIAGTGEKGFHGDFGRADLAQMNFPTGIDFRESEIKDDDGKTTTYRSLYIADSGNNSIRLLSLQDTPNVNVLSTFIGNSHQTVIHKDFVSSLVTQNATEFKAGDHKIISQKAPSAGGEELATLISASKKIVYNFFDFNQAQFYFPSGINVNESGDVFIVDSLNNQIKLALTEESDLIKVKIGETEPKIKPHFSMVFSGLTKDSLENKVVTIVRPKDFMSYNVYNHVLTSDNDYLSPYPLRHMFFKVHGVTDKILMSNLSIESLKSEALGSNNFQFSVSLRNPVE